MYVPSGDTLTVIANATICTSPEEFIALDYRDSENLRVDGDHWIINPDGDNPIIGFMTCEGDSLTVTDHTEWRGGGSWTRVPEDREEAIKGLFFERCEGFARCLGDVMPAGQCSQDGDCPSPADADPESVCDTGKCYIYCYD